MRPDFDNWAYGVAVAVAERGDCTHRKVGAVILNPDHRIVGTGYNGAPPGVTGCLEGGCPRGRHYHSESACACGGPLPCGDAVPSYAPYDTGPGKCIALHAELNACIDAGRKASNYGTIVITCRPCFGCIKVIQAAGIARIVYPDDEGGLQVIVPWPGSVIQPD